MLSKNLSRIPLFIATLFTLGLPKAIGAASKDPGWTHETKISRYLSGQAAIATGCTVQFDRSSWASEPKEREMSLLAIHPSAEPRIAKVHLLCRRQVLPVNEANDGGEPLEVTISLPVEGTPTIALPSGFPGAEEWIRIRPLYRFRTWRVASIEVLTRAERIIDGTQTQLLLDRADFQIDYGWSSQDTPVERAVEEHADIQDVLNNLLINPGSLPYLQAPPSSGEAEFPIYLRQPALMVVTEKEGIYRVPHKEIAEVLGENLQKDHLSIYHDGKAIPIAFWSDFTAAWGGFQVESNFAAADSLVFYAPPADSPYSSECVFWVTMGNASPRAIVAEFAPLSEAIGDLILPGTALLEEDHTDYVDEDETMKQDASQASYWFWQLITPGQPFERSLPLRDVAPTEATSTMRIYVASEDLSRYNQPRIENYAIHVNGRVIKGPELRLLQEMSKEGRTVLEAILPADLVAPIVKEASFTIAVGCPADLAGATGTESIAFYLDKIQIQYQRQIKLYHGQTQFTAKPEGDRAWLIPSDWVNYRYLITLACLEDGRFVFLPSKREKDGFHLASGALLKLGVNPQAEVQFVMSDEITLGRAKRYNRFEKLQLRSAENKADAIIISSPFFKEGVEAIEQMYVRQGLSVMKAWTDDIYCEFSDGRVSPHAIRDFLRYAFEHWKKPAPAYVLLVGDASWDWQERFANAIPNFLPAYRKDPYYASDNWYACVSGEDAVPDLFLGRLPVRDQDDMLVAIRKAHNALEDPDVGPWRGRALFVSDNYESAGNLFEKNTRQLMENWTPPGLDMEQILFRDFAYEDNRFIPEAAVLAEGGKMKYSPDANLSIIRDLREGRALFEYYGHGGPNVFGHERILFGGGSIYSDIKRLDNGSRLPFAAGMTCDSGRFDYADVKWNLGIGEELLLHGNGGAIGVFASSGKGYPHQHLPLMEGMHEAIFRFGWRRMGVVSTVTKLLYAMTQSDNTALDMFLLLGDPFVPVPLAQTALKVSLNKESVDLRYGGYVRVTVELPPEWPTNNLKARIYARDGKDHEFFSRNDVSVEDRSFQFGFDVTRKESPGLCRVGCYIYQYRLSPDDPLLEGIGSASFKALSATDTVSATAETGLPNLSFVAPSPVFSDYSPRSGRTLFIDATVENNGSATARNINLSCYDGDPKSGGKEISDIVDWPKPVIESLRPGEKETVRFRWDTFLNTGERNLTVVVDPEGHIAESNEEDNSAVGTLRVRKKADLIVDASGTEVFENERKPDFVNVHLMVKNIGESKADGFLPPGDFSQAVGRDGLGLLFRVYPSKDGLPVTAVRPFPALAPGESLKVGPIALSKTAYKMNVEVDPDEIVDEETHTNNRYDLMVEDALRIAKPAPTPTPPPTPETPAGTPLPTGTPYADPE